MSARTITVEDELRMSPAARTRLADWLTDHGVTPSACFKVAVSDDHLTAHCYALNEQGRKYIEEGEAALAEPLTVALKRPCPV